jgi:tetratricopeptide (TPR) repeat protein
MTSLYLSYDADFDLLVALEFGRVADGQHAANWRAVCESVAYLHEDRPLGFSAIRVSELDLDEVEPLWHPPLFDVPLLGLHGASAAEILLATRAQLHGESTLNRVLFDDAVAEEDPLEAATAWTACLQAGDAMAHYGLGYTLYELGHFHEAYRHLRHYAQLAPHDSWNCCWLGKAAEAIGEVGEARAAYERALALERDGDQETEATERLAALTP